MVGSGLVGSGMVAWSPGIGVDQRPSLLPCGCAGIRPGIGGRRGQVRGCCSMRRRRPSSSMVKPRSNSRVRVAVAQGLAELDQPRVARRRPARRGRTGRRPGRRPPGACRPCRSARSRARTTPGTGRHRARRHRRARRRAGCRTRPRAARGPRPCGWPGPRTSGARPGWARPASRKPATEDPELVVPGQRRIGQRDLAQHVVEHPVEHVVLVGDVVVERPSTWSDCRWRSTRRLAAGRFSRGSPTMSAACRRPSPQPPRRLSATWSRSSHPWSRCCCCRRC